MSDTWSDLQAFKSRQSSIRERLQRRKQKVNSMVLGITNELTTPSSGSGPTSPVNTKTTDSATDIEPDIKPDSEIEAQLLVCLCDVALSLPTDSRALVNLVAKALNRKVPHLSVENLLQKFAVQELITIQESLTPEGKSCLIVSTAEHTKLLVLSVSQRKASTESDLKKLVTDSVSEEEPKPKKPKDNTGKDKIEDSIESLLSLPSAREKETKKLGAEILELLSKPTAKERSLVERFRSQGGAQVKEFCPHGVTEECMKVCGTSKPCLKLHFKKIIQKHTDESLGDCSFLNTCFHMDTCKYVHYEVDYSTVNSVSKCSKSDVNLFKDPLDKPTVLYPSQWIQCDLRFFDMLILGKFAVIMADPPWDIHMELPYGTMSDDEMRQLNVPGLQDEGLIFLWVTGRAMELGRECLRLWGYQRCDEIIWVKTNQLQRIIRTGRTGHWLNHGKEHCLVGVKGNVQNFNRGLDCDVIVAEVRATSHKPDEIYGIIERLSPGTRKIELFGRPHNVQPNWITLGNQLDGVRLLDPVLIEEFRKRYPDGNCLKKE